MVPYKTLRLRDVRVDEGASISLLGFDGRLVWEADGDDLVISMPDVRPDELPRGPAYAFRIEGVGAVE